MMLTMLALVGLTPRRDRLFEHSRHSSMTLSPNAFTLARKSAQNAIIGISADALLHNTENAIIMTL